MPKNLKGGNKAKSLKNSTTVVKNREIEVPLNEDNSHVAIITKIFGYGKYNCQIMNHDGLQPKEHMVNLTKRVKSKYGRGILIGVNTHVLIAFREFEKNKADIIFVYRDSELPFLINSGHIKINTKSNINDEIQFSEYIHTNDSENKNEDEINLKDI
jgi:hypothetical protein